MKLSINTLFLILFTFPLFPKDYSLKMGYELARMAENNIIR